MDSIEAERTELEAVACEFWMVWTKAGRPPRFRHNLRESALVEAKRLALANPGRTFIVMRGEEKFRVPGSERADEPATHPIRVVIGSLTGALEGLLKHYVDLVNCGDCGNWDPETEAPVIAAREALKLSLR